MRKIDSNGLLLCKMQGDLFEKSIKRFNCSSEIFIRRFINSNISIMFDSGAILNDSTTIEQLFDQMLDEYGEIDYGNNKYQHDVMYWIGYLYRYFCYTYNLSSKQVYKIIKPKELKGLYLPYHTLDCTQAIERILEAKNISFSEEAIIARGVALLKEIRKRNNVYQISSKETMFLLNEPSKTYGLVEDKTLSLIFKSLKKYCMNKNLSLEKTIKLFDNHSVFIFLYKTISQTKNIENITELIDDYLNSK